MHLILPSSGPLQTPLGDDAVAELVADEHRGDGHRAWVFSNMVATIDGAATLEGRSGGLGGPGDRELFSALRGEADVILVGAETVRVEGYRLARAPRPVAARRRAERGQSDRPRLCIVTRSAELTGSPPLLDELPNPSTAQPWERPLLATIHHDPPVGGFDRRFDRIEAGAESVDLTTVIAELARRGLRRVLCEGGPSLLAQLASAGLVDEWNFTVAPIVAGGNAVRPVHSASPIGTRLRLDRLLRHDDSTLFARYLTDRPAD